MEVSTMFFNNLTAKVVALTVGLAYMYYSGGKSFNVEGLVIFTYLTHIGFSLIEEFKGKGGSL